MDLIVPILIAVIVVAVVALLFLALGGRKSAQGPKPKKGLNAKDRNSVLKEATKRLSINPKDGEALLALGDLYFRDQAWERAMKTYEALIELCGSNPEIDEFEVNMRYGLAAVKLQRFEEAYKGLYIARTIKQDDFEVNYNLGFLEFTRKAYEKAIPLLTQARSREPDNPQVLRYLGHSLFKTKNFKEALVNLRKAIDIAPDDKESLFAMGEAYYELGNSEQAVRIFSHLRADPALGPSAALFSGTLLLNQRQYQRAIMDFEIGLKHQNIKVETLVELKYRLATAYLKLQEISRTVQILNEIQSIYPNYKDVVAQLGKYQELNLNKNLQVFLIAPISDFVTLCRKMSMGFFPKAKVKVVDISVQKNEYADILAEVETSKWSDLVLFRYIRTTGQIGELILRDLYSKIKDLKAGKGYCIAGGTFTDEAKRFVEARLIDLIDKERLSRLLNGLEAGVGPA